MNIPESEFPLYFRSPAAPRVNGAPAPIAKTVETTATVLVDLDIYGRILGVEILGELPTTTEWCTNIDYGHTTQDYPVASLEEAREIKSWGRGKDAAIWKRQVTGWVEVDEKETGDA